MKGSSSGTRLNMRKNLSDSMEVLNRSGQNERPENYATASNPASNQWFLLASNGRAGEMKRLYEMSQPDINSVDNKGRTALMLACRIGSQSTVMWLLGFAGINPNVADVDLQTALHYACMQGVYDQLIIERLVAKGADVNSMNKYHWTPLMIAAFDGVLPLCQLLVSLKADTSLMNSKRMTCVDLAKHNNHVACFDYLKEVFCRQTGLNYYPYTELNNPSHSFEQVGEFSVESTASGNPNYRQPVRSRSKRFNKETVPNMTNLPRSKSLKQKRNENELIAERKSKPTPPTSRTRMIWRCFSIVMTCWAPSIILSTFNIRDSEVRQAWREKVASCIIILAITVFYGYLSFGMAQSLCHIPSYRNASTLLNNNAFVVRGSVFAFDKIHKSTGGVNVPSSSTLISGFKGKTVNFLFPTTACSGISLPSTLDCKSQFCHDTTLLGYGEGPLALTFDDIREYPTNVLIYNNQIYDSNQFLSDFSSSAVLSQDLVNIVKSYNKLDATKAISSSLVKGSIQQNQWNCFQDLYFMAVVDNTTPGCVATNIIIITSMVMLFFIIFVKFLCAVYFNWFLSMTLGKISRSKLPKSFIVMLVTCYSEGEDSLRTTCDSLTATDYDDNMKLLFLIADGNVTGSGNPKSTPELCKQLVLIEDWSMNAEPKGYFSIGVGPKRINMCQVYAGFYEAKEHKVPTILVIKCGTPQEASGPKAGNRGKRDSQLILMQFFSRVTFNERMTPLDYELFTKIHRLTDVMPTKYEIVCMVDADTLVKPDSLKRMVFAMERDDKVMGLCGETRIANKRDNWVTKIQVYEYFISHHLGKSFESIFGGVTCLPGCFCMYRIKVMNMDGTATPILANPDVVEEYSENVIDTLHKKNLLLLGEDRYLTTLMLRAFPKRKLIFVPKAGCKTVVPDEFKVLLSQRRRWINSTIHNLLELVFVKELCGIFCFSMQFVIFLELVGTVLLPSSLIFLLYLVFDTIIAVILNDTTTVKNNILPIGFFVGVLFSQAFLVLFTKRKISYVGWMLVFLLAMPIWNFVLPLYAFWHFDDVSWGATRKIFGADTNHGGGGDGDEEEGNLQLMYWHEYEKYEVEKKYSDQKTEGRPLPNPRGNTGRLNADLMPSDDYSKSEYSDNHTTYNNEMQRPLPPVPRGGRRNQNDEPSRGFHLQFSGQRNNHAPEEEYEMMAPMVPPRLASSDNYDSYDSSGFQIREPIRPPRRQTNESYYRRDQEDSHVPVPSPRRQANENNYRREQDDSDALNDSSLEKMPAAYRPVGRKKPSRSNGNK